MYLCSRYTHVDKLWIQQTDRQTIPQKAGGLIYLRKFDRFENGKLSNLIGHIKNDKVISVWLKKVIFLRPTIIIFAISLRSDGSIRCINHDIVIGLCSELLMKLSCYILPGFGKKFLVSMIWGSNLAPPERKSSTLPLDHSAMGPQLNTCCRWKP